VDAWDGSFTYKALDRISTLIAHHLVAQGVGPESAVPLCFDKSCWAIAALMGVIKAGGAMAFIDPANPASRRREIISQLNSDYVLTNVNHAASWESMGVRPIIIDSSLIGCLREFGASPRTGVTPETLLYIIFTSGTTSKPKGCLITHKAFLSGALQHAAKSNLDPRSRVMQLASYSFDVSVLEILTSLISGACVCTPDSAAMTQGLANIINTYQITWAFLTPSLVKLVEPYEVPSLQTLVLGGEKLNRADIEKWAAHLQLVNGTSNSMYYVAGSMTLTIS
jgi:non-ribosomal peptide synthetase component F